MMFIKTKKTLVKKLQGFFYACPRGDSNSQGNYTNGF